ncbi:hypothetical protein KCU61_g4725, partial [Aureobasidium melanogenum]
MADAIYNPPLKAATAERTRQPKNRPADLPQGQQKIRRRNRTIASCLSCRQRKLKCDKQVPCGNCQRFQRDCLYIAPALDTAAQQKLAEIKDRLGDLEETLERDVARRAAAKSGSERSSIVPKIEAEDDDYDGLSADDEQDPEPSPLGMFDQVYDNDADDGLMDLGIQLGKLRMSDRVGGLVRPKMSDELNSKLRSANHKSQNLYCQRHGYTDSNASWQPGTVSQDAFLNPGPDFIVPSSNLFFPDPVTAYFLPPRHVADRLITQYLNAVHPVARLVHQPTFESQYNLFWSNLSNGTITPAPIQAILFAAMFSAAVSLSDDAAASFSEMSKHSLVDRLREMTEFMLSRANLLRTTKIDTMQAFIMYMLPLCRTEISRAHSALVGTAIRLAQCMGLHRDGTTFGLSAVDTHVRRLIWYQICFLDVRTCEATGPRPQIRKEEYDTKLPLNVNDTDLLLPSPPTDDLPYWTDMTLSKLKFECFELMRQLWVDMQRMDQKKLTLTSILNRIKKFRATTEAKYSLLVQGNTPKQILAKQMYRASSNRALVVILQRYAVGTNYPMPERLRKLLTEACMGTVEAGIAMETRQELLPWAWYRGAILQYHAAVLLVFEVYARPELPEAARIWSSLDWIFETPPQSSQLDKAEGIIITLRDRLEKYHSVRKLRATADVENQSSPGPSTTSHLSTPATAPHITRSAQTFTTPTMVYSQLPHNEQGPASDASGSHAGVNRDSSADPGMEAVANMDWNEWDKYFAPNAELGTVGAMGNFNLGNFNPHQAYFSLPRAHPADAHQR